MEKSDEKRSLLLSWLPLVARCCSRPPKWCCRSCDGGSGVVNVAAAWPDPIAPKLQPLFSLINIILRHNN